MGKLVLITGGAGFIGTHLARKLLAEGYTVRSLDIREAKDAVPGVTYLQGNILDDSALEAAIEGVDLVYHFAAIVSVPECQNNPLESYRTNFFGSIKICNALRFERERSGKEIRLIFASSAAVYGLGKGKSIALSESDTANEPLSVYAAQKLASEQYFRIMRYQHKLPVISLRFFNVYGIGQDPASPYSGVLTQFMSKIVADQELTIYGDGKQTRDFIHVHDIVDGCFAAQLIKADKCLGQAVNLGSGKVTTILNLVEILKTISGSNIDVKFLEDRRGDVRHSRAAVELAYRLMNHWETKLSLEEGLSELFMEWVRESKEQAA